MSTESKTVKLYPRSHQLKVGFDAPTLAALDRFAAAVGRPKSAVVYEMIAGVAPMLDQFATKIVTIKNLSDHRETMRKVSEQMQTLLEELN